MLNELNTLKKSKYWEKLVDYYNNNFINQIGFFRFEDMHTNFLLSVLKENNIYGLGNYPIEQFIKLIKKKNTKAFQKLDLSKLYKIDKLIVEKQQVISVGRLDLYITCKIITGNNFQNSIDYTIIVENKLFSSESEKQCKKYEEEYLNQDNVIFVYLSLEKNPIISSEKFIKITYKELVDNVLQPCADIEKNNIKFNINEYLKSYIYLYDLYYLNKNIEIPVTKDIEKIVCNILIEYSKCLENLLTNLNKVEYLNFYENNKKYLNIIYTVIYSLNINKSIKKEINNIFLNQRNVEIVKRILRRLLENNENLNLIKYSPVSNWKVFMTKEEKEDKDEPRTECYHLLKTNNNKKQIYYASPVTKSELKAFIEMVDKKYPQYHFIDEFISD